MEVEANSPCIMDILKASLNCLALSDFQDYIGEFMFFALVKFCWLEPNSLHTMESKKCLQLNKNEGRNFETKNYLTD